MAIDLMRIDLMKGSQLFEMTLCNYVFDADTFFLSEIPHHCTNYQKPDVYDLKLYATYAIDT